MSSRTEPQGELVTLNQYPARRRISAVELEDGRWRMSSSNEPLLVIEEETFEDCFVVLEEVRAAVATRASQSSH